MKQKSTILLSFAALLVGSATVIILQQRKINHLSVLSQQLELQRSQTGNSVAAQSKPSSGLDYLKETKSTTALQPLMTQGNSYSRMCSLIDYVEGLALPQVADAFFELKNSLNRGPEAQFLGQMLLSRWTQEDPKAALAGLKKLSTKHRGGVAKRVLSDIASADPQMVAQWLTDPDNLAIQFGIGDTPQRTGDTLPSLVAREWAHKDSAAAAQWAQSLPNSQRRGATNAIIDTLLSTDMGAAATYVMSVEGSSERFGFIGKVAEAWAQRDPLLAIEWAQGLKTDERTHAIEKALVGWAQSSPKDAAAFIDGLPQAQRTERHISEVAYVWGRQDSASAAEWLGNQREGAGKQEGFKYLMLHWTQTNPEAASTWLSQQPPGKSYDRGAESLAFAIHRSDPAAALQWAATISDEPLRSSRVRLLQLMWRSENPEAARAWAKENQIQFPGTENAR